MYLGIRTDAPLAEFYLYEGLVKTANKTWQADRQLARGLLGELETFLTEHELVFTDITGLFIYRGPGSFTGLRIGCSVMNTMAYALPAPIVGAVGEQWQTEAVQKLVAGTNEEIVLPLYSSDARITKPKK